MYRVSPWALTVKDENYYLIAFDPAVEDIRHYRVDKMQNIKSILRSQRLGADNFKVYDLGEYTNQNFGMFSGEEIEAIYTYLRYVVGELTEDDPQICELVDKGLLLRN